MLGSKQRTASVLVALGLILSGCASATAPAAPASTTASATPQRGGVLVGSVVDPGATLDPVTTSSPAASGIIAAVADRLVGVDSHYKLIPKLAASWSVSPDSTTWTVNLRPGLTFNDGSPLTSKDVVATYRRLIAPDSTSPAKGALHLLKQVQADGDSSVKFILSKPFSDFPYLLGGSNTEILPADYKLGTWTKSFVGSGPFVVKSYNPGQSVVFTRNDKYWNADRIYLDGLEFKFFRDQQARVLAAQSGEIDGIWGEPVSADLTSALDRSQFSVQVTPATGFSALVFRVDTAPFNDIKVRQAIAWAIDRNAINNTVWGGDAALGNDTIYSPVFATTPQGLQQRQADPAKVKELLGDRKITFTITASSSDQAYATVLQQQLNATGSFDVSLNILTGDAYFADGKDSPWLTAPATITYWASRPSPSQYIDYIYRATSAWNASRYSNPKLEELSTAYDATTDEAKRQELVNQIGAIQWNDVPIIVAGYNSTTIFTKKSVHLPPVQDYVDAWVEH